jgi:predicted ATPase
VVDLSGTAFFQQLSYLQRAELLYEKPASPAPVYAFKHALIQEVAYALLPQAQKHTVHERTAQAIEALVGDRLAEWYSELAHHYSRSGNTQQAVAYLQRAGQQAADQSAYGEAITHLTRGFELLQHLSEAPERTRQELDLQITLGWALIATKGQEAPEVEQAFTRARELCQQLGETPQLFAVLAGLRAISVVRGELPQARELAEQCLRLAQREQDPAQLMRAYNALGTTLLHLGEFASARASLDQVMALDDPTRDRSAAVRLSNPIQGGSILGVSCRRHAAWTLWYLGYPEQALERSREAIALAQELAHPYSLAYALYFAAELHGLRREAQAAQAQAEAMMVLARQQEFPARVVRGTFLWGWALAAQGQSTEGIAQMRQGLEALHTMGGKAQRPYRLALLAEASAWRGQTAEALPLLDEALALTHRYGGHFYQAEVYRLTGEVVLMQHAGEDVLEDLAPELPMINGHEDEATGLSSQPTKAETYFRQALDITGQQQAKSLELRAAMSLSRLWRQQGRRTDAYQLLAPIYGWFTEGFDTADLQDAKALLDELT